MLCYVPFNECPSFIFCDFIFDGKNGFAASSYVVKMLAAKRLPVEIPNL